MNSCPPTIKRSPSTSYHIKSAEKSIKRVDEFSIVLYSETYDPSHDSYLLASKARYLGKVIDLGCGAGYLTAKLAALGNEVIAIDLSPYAVLSTKDTLKVNDLYNERVHVLQSDGLKALRASKIYNAIYVNPPYLPVNEFDSWLGRTWSGGKDGVEVFINMIYGFDELLLEEGVLYFILSTLSSMESVNAYLSSLGFKVEKLSELCFFMECIELYNAVRQINGLHLP